MRAARRAEVFQPERFAGERVDGGAVSVAIVGHHPLDFDPVAAEVGDSSAKEANSGAAPGIVHTFSNRSDGPVRFLNFNTPAGWEDYMRDLAATLAAGTATPEEIGRVASRYDFRTA